MPSVEPPSTMTTSSGARVCAATDAEERARRASAPSFTVEISETFTTSTPPVTQPVHVERSAGCRRPGEASPRVADPAAADRRPTRRRSACARVPPRSRPRRSGSTRSAASPATSGSDGVVGREGRARRAPSPRAPAGRTPRTAMGRRTRRRRDRARRAPRRTRPRSARSCPGPSRRAPRSSAVPCHRAGPSSTSACGTSGATCRYARTRRTRFLRGSSVPTNSTYGRRYPSAASTSAGSAARTASDGGQRRHVDPRRVDVVERAGRRPVLCDGTRIASARFTAARSPARYSHRQSRGNSSGKRSNARSWTVTTSALPVADRGTRRRIRRVDDVGVVEAARAAPGRPSRVPRRIQRADRSPGRRPQPSSSEPRPIGGRARHVDRNGTSSSDGSACGERRGQLAHVGPDAAGASEPQLVDVERDLHLEASTHRHPPGPTGRRVPGPGSRSRRSPALQLDVAVVRVEHDRAGQAEQHLVVAVVVAPVRVAGTVAPGTRRRTSLGGERRGRVRRASASPIRSRRRRRGRARDLLASRAATRAPTRASPWIGHRHSVRGSRRRLVGGRHQTLRLQLADQDLRLDRRHLTGRPGPGSGPPWDGDGPSSRSGACSSVTGAGPGTSAITAIGARVEPRAVLGQAVRTVRVRRLVHLADVAAAVHGRHAAARERRPDCPRLAARASAPAARPCRSRRSGPGAPTASASGSPAGSSARAP